MKPTTDWLTSMEDTRSPKEHLVLRSLKMWQPNTTVTTWLLSTWLNTLGRILQYLYRFCFLPAKVVFCDVKRHPKALRPKIYFFGTHSRSWNKYKFSQLSWILACTTSIFAARTTCSDGVASHAKSSRILNCFGPKKSVEENSEVVLTLVEFTECLHIWCY